MPTRAVIPSVLSWSSSVIARWAGIASRSRAAALICVGLLLAACADSDRSSSPQDTATAAKPAPVSFEPGACPRTNPPVKELEGATCGFLVVPENRSKSDGRTIRLPVATIHAVAKTAEDPIVYMAGGPGVDPISQETSMLVQAGVNRDRDLILMGQRGTLYAQPPLLCPEIDMFNARGVGLVYDAASTGQKHVAATRACHDRLVRDGVDLAAYNTTENAADFADLRTALGKSQWNVYGTSYGTDLALTYMRQHPQGIRAVVLDSVFPPDLAVQSTTWRSVKEARDNIFAACKEQPACAQRYPDLAGTFTRLVSELETRPVTTQAPPSPGAAPVKVVTDGGAFVQWFVGIGALPAVIPDSIDSLAKGDPAQVAAVRAAGADPSRAGTDGTGLFYGAFCGEWVPYEAQSEILTEGKKLFPTFPDSVLRQAPQLAFLNEDCDVWNVPRAPAEQRSTKPSEIPTLIVSGTFDARTAPLLGEHAAKSLPRSTVVNIPGVGHVVVPKSQCAQQVFHSFLASPSSPDTSCVKTLEPASFTIR